MINYLRAVATKAAGVFFVTLLGAVTATGAFDLGVADYGSALEVSAAAALSTVIWPVATRLANRAAAQKVPQWPPDTTSDKPLP